MRQRRRCNHRASGDDKIFCGEKLPITQGERVRPSKARLGADEFETPARELLVPVISEFLDERILPRHHLFEIESYVLGANSPRPGVLRKVMARKDALIQEFAD